MSTPSDEITAALHRVESRRVIAEAQAEALRDWHGDEKTLAMARLINEEAGK